jgi:hypothetical protein
MPPTLDCDLKRYGASRPVSTTNSSPHHRKSFAIPRKPGGLGRKPSDAGLPPTDSVGPLRPTEAKSPSSRKVQCPLIAIQWVARCVRWPNGVSVIVSPTAIFIVAWGNAPGHWFHSVAFWPTAIVKPHQSHADVQVPGTGDVAALLVIAIQPKGLAENSRWQAPRRHRNLPHTRTNPERVADNAQQPHVVRHRPRHPTPDTRHPTPDTRHPTPDTRHPTPDTCPLPFTQTPAART